MTGRAVLLLAALLAPLSSLAQEGSSPPPAAAFPAPAGESRSEPEGTVQSAAGGPEESLRRGNALYEEGRFEEAAGEYRTALAYGVRNEVLHYNLGNALFRAGRLGRAILEYERALLLAPGDDDIRENLAFARARTVDAPPEEEAGPLGLLAGWLRRPGPNGAAALALGCYLLAAAALGLALMRRGSRLARPALVAAALLFLLAIPPALSVAVQAVPRELDDRAVILEARVEARSGPSEANPLLFTVHEGTTATVLDEREGWRRIVLPDGLNGWIPGAAAERIVPRRP